MSPVENKQLKISSAMLTHCLLSSGNFHLLPAVVPGAFINCFSIAKFQNTSEGHRLNGTALCFFIKVLLQH